MASHLYKLIDESYNNDEIRYLFEDLGLDYESFNGSNKRRKVQELYGYMKRRQQLDELLAQIHADRDFLDLTPFGGPAPKEKDKKETISPANDTQPAAITSASPSAATPSPAQPEEDPNYENFDIHIRPGKKENEFALNAASSAGETDKISYQSLPTDDAYEDQVYYLRELMAKADDAEKLGQTLRNFLFPDAIRDLFLQTKTRADVAEKAGVRIRINIFRESRDLYQIPWEYVRDDKTFMALNEETPIVRYMPVNRTPKAIAVPEQVRILLVWANPSDQDLLDVQGEVAVIQEALAPLVAAGRVTLEVLGNAQASQLRKEVRKNKPHILHFVGHGVLQENGEGSLALEARDGTTAVIDAEKMLVLLQGDDTKLVVLSACQTAATSAEKPDQASARALMGVAPKLVWGGTPAVVAMQFNLPDDAGAPFMETFYEFLADGKPLDTAVTEARIGLYFDFGDQIFWAIPVLFMRAPDGNIW